ncbi:[heparan sulfate]-glucosamine 3-sulfotransferase-like protein [Fragilaria crotonensis]|nr:[heparan sulfate]-glucosamine 3-sulfotransferase-like protein [Fragilaria crotonensis]
MRIVRSAWTNGKARKSGRGVHPRFCSLEPRCGTTSLFQYLQQHPDIIQPRRKELLSFIPQRFRHWAHPGDFESKINVQAARKDMYAHDYRSETIKRRNMSISFEATPDYLLYSRFSAKAILCTVPWVKILVILRNPVDRVFSHYNYLTDVSRMSQLNFSMPKETFEEWILADMVRLAKHGVSISATQPMTSSVLKAKKMHGRSIKDSKRTDA